MRKDVHTSARQGSPVVAYTQPERDGQLGRSAISPTDPSLLFSPACIRSLMLFVQILLTILDSNPYLSDGSRQVGCAALVLPC
jgi:hypothetical protein